MKQLSTSKKIDKLIFAELNNGKVTADNVHEKVCSKLNLYGVKYFGHGTNYQKRKVELIWRSILFILMDFKEYVNYTTQSEKEQIKSYLQINN